MFVLQDPTVYAPVTPLGILASALLVPVVGFISSKLYDGIKTIIPQYDRLPAFVHQIAAPLFGLLFGFLSAATGAELLTDVHGVTAGWIGALLNALAMAGIKRWEKSREPADATVVLERSRKDGPLDVPKVRGPRKPRSNGPNHSTEFPKTYDATRDHTP